MQRPPKASLFVPMEKANKHILGSQTSVMYSSVIQSGFGPSPHHWLYYYQLHLLLWQIMVIIMTITITVSKHGFFRVRVLTPLQSLILHMRKLSLCFNSSKFCLKGAVSWYELEIWMAVWTQRQMAEPPVECMASTWLLFVFPLA